ncbi:MAG: NUDIX domain-containing protein [Verrucomicrobia bacterium]|nr:NUDIX domain-containing protein [Verrucomicrobiota bacterium]
MNSFTIRVYGLLLNKNNEVLISDEHRDGLSFTKFPGGGLEFGEGIGSALIREYREEMEFEAWKKKDPLETYRHKLATGGILDSQEIEKLSTQISRELEDGLAFARQSPVPTGMTDFVYAS